MEGFIMSNETDKKASDLTDPSFTDELNLFFDNFLKEGIIIKEKEISPGFKVKLKVLNTEELLVAESILSSSNPHIPSDVIIKVRAASILSQAILNLNDMAIEREDLTDQENNNRRNGLYKQILKMPALLIKKTYELYVEAVTEQNALYENPSELGKKIENF
jgi:hypothetical protein